MQQLELFTTEQIYRKTRIKTKFVVLKTLGKITKCLSYQNVLQRYVPKYVMMVDVGGYWTNVWRDEAFV